MRLCSSIFLSCYLNPNLGAELVYASSFGFAEADATAAFQGAIRSPADTIIIDLQISDWIVGPCEFADLSDKTIIFQPGVSLVAKPGAFPRNNDCLLCFVRAKNVRIIGYGATLLMQKDEYAALADGEWRHCLSLINSSNVRVYGLNIRDSGGDGLYVSGDSWVGQPLYSENILFRDIWCDNNYRQGISIISARHLLVQNCWFTNTKGTLPMSGVDLEPNKRYQRMEDVVFEKCRFTGNHGNGIQLSFYNLDSSSVPVDITFSDCYLSDNHDPGNRYAAAEIHAGGTVRGKVRFERCMVENSRWTAVFIRKPADAYFMQFRDCFFRNVSQNTQGKYNSPIWLEVTDYSRPCPRFGGASFTDCLLEYSTGYPFLDTYGEIRTSPGPGNIQVNNLTVIHPDTAVSYRLTNGGGSPSDDCIFNYSVYTGAPLTSVEFISVPNLDECAGHSGIFRAIRDSANLDFPLGITYFMKGSAEQGSDFGRTGGFIMIPAACTTGTDTIRVFWDGIPEPVENIILGLKESPFFEAATRDYSVEIADCESPSRAVPLSQGIFSVYPNPVSDMLTVSFMSKSNGVLQLIDLQGRIVLTGEVRELRENLCLDGLKSGPYLVRILVNGRLYHKRILKLY